MSEKEDLWYIQLPLVQENESIKIQTFCNQCAKVVLQEQTEKTCFYCKNEKWSSNYTTRKFREMLVRLHEDQRFRIQIKKEYKKKWNEKFPKDMIPDMENVGELVSEKLGDK